MCNPVQNSSKIQSEIVVTDETSLPLSHIYITVHFSGSVHKFQWQIEGGSLRVWTKLLVQQYGHTSIIYRTLKYTWISSVS